MNWLDIVIIIIILFSGVIGFKRGFFKEIILFIGIIMIFILSYKLKNYIGDFLVLNFPFFKFSNFANGATALNIILYQSIAFILIAVMLYSVYQFIVAITGIFEKILKFTIILGLPSKFLGFFVGLIKGVIITYILLFFINQPALNLQFAKESEYANVILTKTPLLNKVASDSLVVIDEIYELTEIEDVNEMNLKIIDLILKNDVTSSKIVQKLVEKGKLKVENIDTILNKYN